MRIYLKHVSALIKGVEPSSKEKKRNRIFYYVMSIIAIFGIMLPMAFFVGVILFSMTTALESFGTQDNAIELFLHLIAVFSFIFGMNVIFSVFYFSGDIESLLPLPLRPYQIIGSKFTAALISESVMEFIVIIAAFAGYIIGGGLPFYSWVIAVFGMLTLPIVPLIYCGIICMLVMYFTRFVRNKDTVNKITGVFTFLVVVGMVIMLSKSGFDSNALIKAASESENGLLGVMNCIFPHIQFLVLSMHENTLPDLLIYIAINAAAIFIFMLTAQAVYFPSVVGIGQGGVSGKRSGEKTISAMKMRPAWITYMKKEFRLLVRTPAYFTNCFMINLMCPVGVIIAIVIQENTDFMGGFVYGIHSGDEESVLFFMLGVTALSVLVTAVNCIASAGLTREGKHFAFIKYIPLSYMTQINVKALVSIIISGTGVLASVIIACIWLNVGIKYIIFSCMLSILAVAFASYFGIFMDSVNPKLIWDDELNALRGNYNIFFNMALAMVSEGIICTGSWFLYKYTAIGAIRLIILLFTVFMVLAALSYLLCRYRATKNIDSLSG